MENILLIALLGVIYLPFVLSECENGCSGHGRCTAFDMCLCYRNWQGNDCSQRICQFGPAFVDTPKGDLDSSNALDGPDDVVAVNDAMYPYGTAELFPSMRDSDDRILPQSAHEYAECSNAGVCDRTTGECDCFEGFEGSACQRMPCPGSPECSGHGVCQNLQQIGMKNYLGEYRLWNRKMLRGCVCDKGFYGADCSLRRCKLGLDPLFLDDVGTVQFPFFFFAVMTTSSTYDLTDGTPQRRPGKFALKVFDEHGYAFFTRAITAPAECADIIEALEALPRKMFPRGDTHCYSTSFNRKDPLNASSISSFAVNYHSLYRHYLGGPKEYHLQNKPATQDAGFDASFLNASLSNPRLTGDLYLVQFYSYPGGLRQPEIEVYLDGKRPTLSSEQGTLVTRSWSNGQLAFPDDFFPIHCNDVRVRLRTINGVTFLWGTFYPQVLFSCLGESDFDPENNLATLQKGKVFEYDEGTKENPHLIRLVRTQTDYRDGGFLAAVYVDKDTWIDGQSGEPSQTGGKSILRLLHPLYSLDDNDEALYDIFATRGVLQQVNRSFAEFDFGRNRIYLRNASASNENNDISCESMGASSSLSSNTSTWNCLDQNDRFVVLDPYRPTNNPPFLNLYTAESIHRVTDLELNEMGDLFPSPNISRSGVHGIIHTDYNTNWASTIRSGGLFHVYKFSIQSTDIYNHISECSNRGLCNTFEGICECFGGYVGDACQSQSAFAT